MFGSKRGRTNRLEQIVNLLEQNPMGLSQSEIARTMGVERSTISRDLGALEKRGVRLVQDERARVTLFDRILDKK